MIVTTAQSVAPIVPFSTADFGAAEQLAVISTQLDQHFGADTACVSDSSSEVALTQLTSILSQHCQLPNITLLLSSIIQAPELLASIAARSYWHGNGFLKVVLLDKGYKLRLHIWFAGTPCEENIHSHRWGFASHVLTGTLKSELWSDATNDELHTSTLPVSAHKVACSNSRCHLETQRHACEYRYTAKHQHERRTIAAHKQLIGTAHLQKLQNIAQSAGASYVMTPSQLHRINHPGQELVATIICTAPTAVLTNRLFPTTDQPKLHPAKLSADALKIALTRYLEHISPMPLAA